MSTANQRTGHATRDHDAVTAPRGPRMIPPNFFAISMGLAGLAGAWRLAAKLYQLPAAIGEGLYLVAAVVYLLLLMAFVRKLVRRPAVVVAELLHPVFGPFYALLPLSGILLALGLQPYAPGAAMALFVLFFGAIVLLGGWLTGQWMLAPRDADAIHPGYFLPSVAGSFVAADGAAHFGLIGVGWMSFGIGLISWFVFNTIVLNRLFVRPTLPPVLIPTQAILIAPAVVAGNAYFGLTGDRVDMGAYMLAGYAVLMGLVQLRLLPLYMRTPFAPSFWSFTFSYAVVATNAMRWINIVRPVGGVVLVYALLAALTVLVGGIALRSLMAVRQGAFIPAE